MDRILFTATIIIIMPRYVVLESRQAELLFPFSNENHISCDANKHITINNVSVVDDVQCWIDDIGYIKNSCDGKDSCSVGRNATSDCLLQYGYFNVSYICRGANHNCNFESGLCGWSQNDNDNFDWTIQNASASQYGPVPISDHTTGSQFGHVLHSGKLSKYNEPYYNQKARLTSNLIVSNIVLCLTFWYQIHGTSRGILHIYQQTENQLGSPVGTISSYTGYIWYRKDIELKYLPFFRIVFESVQGGDSSSIAVDDVSVHDGNCSGSHFDCTFENNNLCGWNVEEDGLTKWSNVRPYDYPYPYSDHTTGSAYGHNLRVVVRNQQQIRTTRLLRNDYTLSIDSCLTFWYNILYYDSGTLHVSLRSNGTYTTLWKTSNATSLEWSQANIDINAREINDVTFIIIECTFKQYAENTVAIDDISVRTGTCSGDKKYERRYNSTLDILLIDSCPKQFLDVRNFSFNYYPKYSECEDVYKQAQVMTMEMCSNFNISDAEYCNISVSAIKDKNRHCFVLPKTISVNYTCGVSATNSIGELNQEETLKVIGIGVGAGAALLVLIIIILCFVKRRNRLVNKKKQKRNRSRHSSDLNDATSGKQGGVKDEDVEIVYYNEQYREQGIFMTMSNLMNEPNNTKHSGTTKESSNDIVYYNLNTKFMNKMSNQSKPNMQRPEIEKITDFNTDNKEDEYDRTNSIRLKREEHNVYSHAVDDVYDNASQTKNLTREEDVSYDHFVGGTYECNYSVVHKKPKN